MESGRKDGGLASGSSVNMRTPAQCDVTGGGCCINLKVGSSRRDDRTPQPPSRVPLWRPGRGVPTIENDTLPGGDFNLLGISPQYSMRSMVAHI
jgi:hypothetical protein